LHQNTTSQQFSHFQPLITPSHQINVLHHHSQNITHGATNNNITSYAATPSAATSTEDQQNKQISKMLSVCQVALMQKMIDKM